ncbi:MAG: hypothetical protein DWQ31_17740 [Planctomycetota bacterium]|nr:MAG: hypothetical protein DWQ31_17740 [Planctomycetota bacterium]REJ96817.1 MAG: hypothetical protein DWQ35_03380 [Planctomycetota bacterium]
MGFIVYNLAEIWDSKRIDCPKLRDLRLNKDMWTMSRWHWEFSALDPNNPGSEWTVGIAESHYRCIRNAGHDKAHARILLVKEVLETPVAIRKGWSRQGKSDDCLTYIGKPAIDYHKICPEICVPAPPGMVFLVFVTGGGTIDEWTWRKHKEGDITAPDDVEGELIWQPNQT